MSVVVVVVEQYNPEWPSHFRKIKYTLEAHLEGIPVVSIEHVGSTSVPCLAAKPIIDIDIIVSRDNIQPAIDVLVAKANFTYLGEMGMVDRHALHDPDQSPARNIYVCVNGVFQTRNHLAVRDTLRSNPALRDEYARVKLELAASGINIAEYVQAKSAILQKILRTAGLLSENELEAISAANSRDVHVGAVRTARLVLKEFVMADVERFYQLESKPEVVRYQTWPPRTREQAHGEVATIIRNSSAAPRSHIELAVTYDDVFIGRVGANIRRISEDSKPMDPVHVDLWFSFMPEMQGKGFATEAMIAFVDLLMKRNRKVDGEGMRLEIECDPRNTGSWKLAERLGFERISLTEKAFECKGDWVGSLVYQKVVQV